MENDRYMKEGLDLKRMSLLFFDKIWFLLMTAVAGAFIGAGLYLAANLVFAPEKEYESVSKFYLNFDCDPSDYNELSYNGYTWNDLMKTDPILNYTMEGLPTDIDRETVMAATKAEILSDIRLLTITITTGNPDLTEKITIATKDSLLHLGESDELFVSIEDYGTVGPKRIIWDNRVTSAALTGAVCLFVFVLACMLFYYILDDSLYVEADGTKRYNLPVLGIVTANEPGTFQSYANEFLSNYRYCCKGKKKISLLSVDCMEDAIKTKQIIEKILSTERNEENHENIPVDMPETSTHIYENIRQTDGVILLVRFGRRNGKLVERAIGNMRMQDCNVIGIVIVEAKESFLKKYYMFQKEKRK